MKPNLHKTYSTIGCCGIDCGLCPRYYTEGISRCPGCLGIDFFDKHPSCSISTCCVKNKGLEVCSECKEFPCSKIDKWDSADSFVTHKKSVANLKLIKEFGIKTFIKQQNNRINLLEKILKEFDDGRSKSFFCLAVALLSIEEINTAIIEMNNSRKKSDDKKALSKALKAILKKISNINGIELIYRNKKA